MSGYVLRRVGDPNNAADCVAETFFIAWRKLGEVPEGDAALYWLYAVARRVMANHRRTARRYEHLTQRLAVEFSVMLGSQAPADTERLEAADVVASLRPEDREVLLLTGWEGLGPDEVALVLGCSAATARVRLHRARSRLARALVDGLKQTASRWTPEHAGVDVPTRNGRSS